MGVKFRGRKVKFRGRKVMLGHANWWCQASPKAESDTKYTKSDKFPNTKKMPRNQHSQNTSTWWQLSTAIRLSLLHLRSIKINNISSNSTINNYLSNVMLSIIFDKAHTDKLCTTLKDDATLTLRVQGCAHCICTNPINKPITSCHYKWYLLIQRDSTISHILCLFAVCNAAWRIIPSLAHFIVFLLHPT